MTQQGKKKKRGMSEVAKREERLAIMMLLPSFVVILLIAIYPLFTVFSDSLTNKTFASDEPVQFVGLGNYVQLLSVTIAELPPVIDPATGQQKINQNGQLVYESPVSVLPREPARYKELNQFDFLDKHYVIGATEKDFIRAIFDTVLFSVITVSLETILGLGIALVVNSGFRGRGLMRATMLVPWAIPTVVSARVWEWMFTPTRAGFFNAILNAIGIGDGQTAFLREGSLQLPAIIVLDVWKTTPFMALLLLAGLQLIPGDLYEAAEVDGASAVRRFFNITLPLLRPTLAVALIFRTLDALRVFDVFQVLLSRTRYSMASFAQDQLIQYQNAGLSSAASVFIFLLILIFAIVYIRTLGVEST
ncbi:MAG: sugar ABC transporter permease [Chloroflexi bacterium]|nr:sugar ABC transporter permease [Chloroflexota bacterium]